MNTYNNLYKTGYLSKNTITSVREQQNLTSQMISSYCKTQNDDKLQRRDFYPIDSIIINKVKPNNTKLESVNLDIRSTESDLFP